MKTSRIPPRTAEQKVRDKELSDVLKNSRPATKKEIKAQRKSWARQDMD